MDGLVIKYCMAVVVIFSGVIEALVLSFTKTAKGAVLVFLRSKFVAVLIGGLSVLARCICISKEVGGPIACFTILSGIYISVFNYLAHTALAYIDLHISLKRMAINDPVITKRKAVIMSVFIWAISISMCGLGALFENPEWDGDSMDNCRRGGLFHLKEYTITMIIIWAVLLLVLVGMNFATWKLLNDSIRNSQLHNPNPAQADQIPGRQKESDAHPGH